MKINKKVAAFALSIMMVFTMTPMIAFAEPTGTTEDTSSPEANEPVSQEVSEPSEDGQETQLDPLTEQEDTAETAAEELQVAKAGGNPIFQPGSDKELWCENGLYKYGTARNESIGQYSRNMRIYGLYLHRNGGYNSADRYGDAVLIESNGKYLLMDMGDSAPTKGSNKIIASSIVDALKQIGVRELDIYISHMHEDHVGGRMNMDDKDNVTLSSFGQICSNFKVNKLYVPDIETCRKYVTPNGRTIYTVYNEKLHELYGKYYRYEGATEDHVAGHAVKDAFTPLNKDAEIVFLSPSFRSHARTAYNHFNVGAAQVNVIGPIGTYSSGDARIIQYYEELNHSCGTPEGHALNNSSLCTVINCGNFRYLSTGDIEKFEEAYLVSRYGYGLNCDIMKLPHHGLRTSTTDSFTSRVSPMWSFAENHGYTSSTAVNQSAFNTAKRYGYNIKVANNRHSSIYDVSNNTVRVFIDYNNNNRPDDGLVTGWVSTGGGTQYYDGAGHIHTGWNWLSGHLYYMSGSSGFRYTGSHKISGVKVKFNSSGQLTSHSKPSKVKARSAKGKKGGKVRISWKKASRASAYQVYRATSKSGSYSYIKTSKSRSYTNGGLVKGKKYYYKVRAIRYVAGGVIYGSFSGAKGAKAK